ncbi:MAG TPA: M23 family metallopeptidase [Candidatus Paceibacterota bacterium]|jgi:murein DD-endopeptidase MepM/ murein hydrolase activator NlpD
MAERLRLRKPITPCTPTQNFGDDLTCVDLSTKTLCTTRLRDEACPPGFGSLYASLGLKGHNGIDLAAREGQPVYAATDGVVEKLEQETNRGLGIVIRTVDRFRFDSLPDRKLWFARTYYWHLDAFAVRKGDTVTAGQLIGWAGSTGLSSGPHLHFELKPVKRGITGRFSKAFPQNGYFGAVDPSPYLTD